MKPEIECALARVKKTFYGHGYGGGTPRQSTLNRRADCEDISRELHRLEAALAEAEAKVEGYASELHSVGIRAEQAESALADQKAHGSRLADEITSLRNTLAAAELLRVRDAGSHIDELYQAERERDEAWRELRDLLHQIQRSRVGHAPEPVYADCLFNKERIDALARQHPEETASHEHAWVDHEFRPHYQKCSVDGCAAVRQQPEASGPVGKLGQAIHETFRKNPTDCPECGVGDGQHQPHCPTLADHIGDITKMVEGHGLSNHDIDEVFGHAKDLREEQRP